MREAAGPITTTVLSLYTSHITAAMNHVLLVVALAATTAASYVAPASHVVSGPVLVRAPAHDSAIIQSHRLGGNFAYSTHEAHAYAEQRPIIGHRTVPVGVSYHQGQPLVHSTTDYVSAHVPSYGYVYPRHVQYSVPHYVNHAAPAHTVVTSSSYSDH